jgi:cytochrome c553
LGGQHAQYIAKQLTDFRKEEGGRANDGDAMTMRTIARKLSDEDIAAVSSYIQGLH